MREISNLGFLAVLCVLVVLGSLTVPSWLGLPPSTDLTLLGYAFSIPTFLVISLSLAILLILLAVVLGLLRPGGLESTARAISGKSEIADGALAQESVAETGPLSGGRAGKTFDELAKIMEGYCSEAKAYLGAENCDPVLVDGIVKCALTNLLTLTRGVLTDEIPRGVTSNVMIYEQDGGRLCLIEATDFVSYDAVTTDWALDDPRFSNPESHPGIAARSFLLGQPELVQSMNNEKKLRDEPLRGMVSIPLKPRSECRDRDLAVVNLNYFVDGFVPEELTTDQRRRITTLVNVAEEVNEVYRQWLRMRGMLSAQDPTD
ncbi:hypothetical protein JANAI62_21640 [Jannaschia pagri]|uniref:GAF domain-containing protein n=1 Tax=Jannaschia pagri TaxID=2829797 RepID=A0ABQ4NMA2_9RHOB|nr:MULTISPECIES: hypothetical protein [unclassified Jannaschia]GIT91707.1 hypothetical protein JANAI61_21650 [Jannaschia sp. AI_61]GIT95541.1 hypothetical protein JANAI62_21640 [Jannaschia sp. AI_62]